MPDPRDYPDPIGYAVASADWWRAREHVRTSSSNRVPIVAGPGTELRRKTTP
jgi:hypothetical protein